MDNSKLKGKIVEVFGTRRKFAKAMGISEQRMNLRINGDMDWKTPEIVKACNLLGIELKDAWEYFLVEKL